MSKICIAWALTVSTLLAGEFGPGTVIPFLRQQRILLSATGDLNRDGLADIVAVGGTNAVGIRISETGGARSIAEIPLGVTGQPVDLLLADLDSDGAPEIVTLVVNGGSQARLCVIQGSRSGDFRAPTCTVAPATAVTPSAALRLHAIRVPAVNLPFVGNVPPVSAVLLVDGPRGVLLPATPLGDIFSFGTPLTLGHNVEALAVADLNGDGFSDAVYSSNPLGLYEVNLSTILRGSIGVSRFNTNAWGPLVLTDLDLDNRPDVAVLDSGTNRVRFFTGSVVAGSTVAEYREGTAIPLTELPATGRALFAADVDRDGRVDLVARTATSLTLLRAAAPQFAFDVVRNLAPVLNTAINGGFSIADVNGDQQNDLVYFGDNYVEGSGLPTVSNVILHTGRPSFTETTLELSTAIINTGTPLKLTARVLNASQTGGFGRIAGTIQFMDGTATLETVNVSVPAGVTVVAMVERQLALATVERVLAPGAHDLRAVFSGSGGFLGSSSRGTAVTVRGTSSELRITSVPAIVNRGEALPLALDVISAGAVNIAGEVVAFYNQTRLAQATVANGKATLTLPTGELPLGPVRVRLRYESPALPAAEIEAALFVSGRISVANAAAYQAVLVPDSIAILQAPGLAALATLASALPWPTSLAGLTVEVRDAAGTSLPGRLYYAGPNQVNFLAPAGLAEGAGEVRLGFGGEQRLTTTVRIARSTPGIFTATGDGRGVPAALAVRVAANGAQTPVAVSVCDASGCRATPIELRRDEQLIVSLYGTGWRGANNIAVSIGGMNAELLYRGGHPEIPGLDQINFRVPYEVLSARGREGEVEVYVTADAVESNRTRLEFQ